MSTANNPYSDLSPLVRKSARTRFSMFDEHRGFRTVAVTKKSERRPIGSSYMAARTTIHTPPEEIAKDSSRYSWKTNQDIKIHCNAKK